MLLFQQELGHRDLEVDDLIVAAREHATHDVRDLRHGGSPINLHDELVELIVISLLGALVIRFGRIGLAVPACGELHLLLRHLGAIAISEEHRWQRNVHVHVGVANA